MTIDAPSAPVTQETGPAQAPPALPRARFEPGAVLGDWRVEGVIGIGGMGTVYSAVHTVIGKRAALKVVRAELCSNPLTGERFVQEAWIANQIGHPNIVDIFHIGTLDDRRPYLVMELLRGETLGQRMARGRVLPHEAADILLQICAALGAAHARGVVHRDLKPDNVFLVETGGAPQVKLVDWGIAKLMDAMPVSGTCTTAGTLLGTPQYMSPEQARGRSVDGRTDVYSLGAIAYELFLEGPPFQADNIADLVTMHLREPVPPPGELWPDVPPELERLLVAMLAKSPDDRPSLEEVQQTLRRVRDALETRGRWHGSTARAVPALAGFDRAPTWAMSPPGAADDSSSALRVRPRVDTRPTSPRTRAVAFLATVLIIAAVGTVGTDLFVDPALAPAAQAEEGEAPAPAARFDLPEIAPPMRPGEPPETVLASAPPAALPAMLDLRVKPRTATVTVGGARVQVSNGRVVHPVEPGVLEIAVEAPGRASYRRSIEIGPGTLMLEVNLKPVRAEEPRAPIERQPESRRVTLDIDPDGTIDPFE